jgi:hypothetical protein
MTYSLVIDGTEGARKVRRGLLPRRGEWLSVEIHGAWWWLPVLEVSHVLYGARSLTETEDGCDLAHEQAEAVVFTSFTLGVKAEAYSKDEAYRLVLPPTRWPFGGRVDLEIEESAYVARK